MGKGWSALPFAQAGAYVSLIALFCFSPLFAYAAAPCPSNWTRPLQVGATGDDVAKLQQYLGVTPQSGWFGPVTKAAVATFQEKYAADILAPNGLTKGTGFFGASTRAKLNGLCNVLGASMAAPAPHIGLTVTVPDQPAATVAPANAGYVPFTTFTLTAGDTDVTVSSVMVKRVGPASDQVFYDIDLLDDSGDYASTAFGFTTAHLATFKDPLVIPAHTSKVMSVVGDMAIDLSGHSGELAGLEVESIQADQPVTGPLPLVGTLQMMNATIVIGSVTSSLGSDDPRTARTQYVNDTNVTFSGIRVTAGSQEDVKMNSIAWYQSGSAGPDDITNVRTIVNGVSYPATLDGRHYTSTFPDGIVIHKGDAVDIAVKGDLTVTGSNRTVEFDLDQGSDADFTGMQYGFGVFLIPGDNTDVAGTHSTFLTQDGSPDTASLTPFFAGSITTISPGAFTSVGKSSQ
jgi:hypothetical protein